MRNFMRRMTRILLASFRITLRFLTRSLGILAEGAQSSREDDVLNSSIRGGELNFRTGKFDDGTDPAGWYGRD